ncbi:MAG: alpha-glucosidase [Candidatus Ventricola sp.]
MSTWWQRAVVYQVYPRSFYDSNGDGIGDLNGVRAKLDYIRRLGVDVIWLNPIYKSPNDDNGYDISDYRAIMDEFGTMEDFDRLLAEAHEKGLRIVMDLVVNHTSDEHPWFIESRSSAESPYRDYYIWREGKDGNPPNNWGASFRGSAWERCEETGMYYLHTFSKKQPDLNWENETVRGEVYDLMRFWLDKGIDGFRMDVINYISKTPEMPDGPMMNRLYGNFRPYCLNGPRVHEFLKEMNREVLSHYDVMTVGETPGVSVEQAQRYTGPDEHELNMVFQFAHVNLDYDENGKWTLKRVPLDGLRRVLSEWQTGLHGKGWNSLYLNNHDQPRMVSRFGDDSTEALRSASAKMLGVLMHMMQGTPYVYQGEELGMTNVAFPDISDYRDIDTLNAWNEMTGELGVSPEHMMACIHRRSRDNARTPMQWSAAPNAGFTTGTPWIGVNPNYRTINAEAQENDPDSVLCFYRRLIALRRELPIITEGDYALLLADHPQIFAYQRSWQGQRLYVICSFSAQTFDAPEILPYCGGRLLLCNYAPDGDAQTLRPYEARVYLVGE